MKIGIYINNSHISKVDCRNLSSGNPGIGGTEYSILLLADQFKKKFPGETLVLVAQEHQQLPNVDKVIYARNVLEATAKIVEERVDIWLVSAVDEGLPLPHRFFETITKYQLKTILWAHNYYLSDYCREISMCSSVKVNVFVGKQQFERYLDNDVYSKSTYIFNMYPNQSNQLRQRDLTTDVTYIGSIVPSKGFHILAKAWRDVLKEVPDAKLKVVGSGALYDKQAQIGKYGIAEKRYEESFIKYLVDSKGDIIPSVEFLGVMGSEKQQVIMQTAVGVPNPSGRTETFGLSALDFESKGVPIVTIGKNGFLDTVINQKTGLLYSNKRNLAKNIIQLLNNRSLNEKYGRAGYRFSQKFAPDKILDQWYNLFEQVVNKTPIINEERPNFLSKDLKWLRIINKKFKDFSHLTYTGSVVGVETFGRNLLRKIYK